MNRFQKLVLIVVVGTSLPDNIYSAARSSSTGGRVDKVPQVIGLSSCLRLRAQRMWDSRRAVIVHPSVGDVRGDEKRTSISDSLASNSTPISSSSADDRRKRRRKELTAQFSREPFLLPDDPSGFSPNVIGSVRTLFHSGSYQKHDLTLTSLTPWLANPLDLRTLFNLRGVCRQFYVKFSGQNFYRLSAIISGTIPRCLGDCSQELIRRAADPLWYPIVEVLVRCAQWHDDRKMIAAQIEHKEEDEEEETKEKETKEEKKEVKEEPKDSQEGVAQAPAKSCLLMLEAESKDARTEVIRTALRTAVFAGNYQAIQLLLDVLLKFHRAGRINLANIITEWELSTAARSDKREVIALLITAARAAGIPLTTIITAEVLASAARFCKRDAVELLITTAETAGIRLATIITIWVSRNAALFGKCDVVELLITTAETAGIPLGAIIAAEVLKEAIHADSSEIVTQLLTHAQRLGIDVLRGILTKSVVPLTAVVGLTALECARSKKNQEIIKIIEGFMTLISEEKKSEETKAPSVLPAPVVMVTLQALPVPGTSASGTTTSSSSSSS